MKVVKKYVFWSAKSSGNTLISLNMALTHQQWKGEQKVCFLQLSHFPDIHTYLEEAPKQTILDLKYFLDADETPDTYPKDTYPSPLWNEWEELKVKDVKNILAFLEKKYDTIYIDLNVSVGEEIISAILNEATKIVLPCHIDPASLAGVESFFSKYDFLKERCVLIFNQCPPLSASVVKQKLKRRDIKVLGTLPVARKYMWAQIFEAVPLAMRKKCPWKKSLFKLLKKLNE
jgi:cellulose biosynthesis protein BcsQ